MDLREAAEALGVHYQTAYAWARDGTLLPARPGGAMRSATPGYRPWRRGGGKDTSRAGPSASGTGQLRRRRSIRRS